MALIVLAVAVLACLPCLAMGQLADNLMVSGSDKPMAYGVGTYGLQGAGTQGVSGQSEGGGLFSPKIPTVTISNRIPGVVVSDGAGHATVYQNGIQAFSALDNILQTGIQKQIKAHFQEAAPGNGGTSFAIAQAPVSAPATSQEDVYNLVDAADSALQEGGRRLQQASILQNIGAQASQALSAVKQTIVGGTSDMSAELARAFQPGDLPTISTADDGTVQLLSNNNSGDELQLRRDGTLTYVNGGSSPGIFSVGPSGVHLEKDNIFGSKAYSGGGGTPDQAGGPAVGQGGQAGGDPNVYNVSNSAGTATYTVEALAPQAGAAGPSAYGLAPAPGAAALAMGAATAPAAAPAAAGSYGAAYTQAPGQQASSSAVGQLAASAATAPAGAAARPQQLYSAGAAAQAPASMSYGAPAQPSSAGNLNLFAPAGASTAAGPAGAPSTSPSSSSSAASAYLAQPPTYVAQAPTVQTVAASSYGATLPAGAGASGSQGQAALLSNTAMQQQQQQQQQQQVGAAAGSRADLQRLIAMLGRRLLRENLAAVPAE